MLPLAQTWMVVQTGARGVTEESVDVHLPTACRFGDVWASVTG